MISRALFYLACYSAALFTVGCGEKTNKQETPSEAATSTPKTGQSQVEKPAKPTTSTKDKALIAEEARLRMQNFIIPEGMQIDLWADESQTLNPAFLSFDSRGRMFVAEIGRIHKGVSDIRRYPEMTAEDIMIESSADRLAMYKKHASTTPMSYYTSGTDQIRLLEDTDNDGFADKSTLFATNFNEPLDGIGSGVIERDGKIYYTNIPHLWMLQDKDDDGVAEDRVSLQDGFGIRMSFFGHDMHGLAWGPDGKLYWSIGDRGYSFTTREGNKFHGPNIGAVFRANADGSDIEVFYTGLRNPQELAFDDFGNLFTADNDGDGGDVERINYIVEGGDSGWHAGHQSIISFTSRLELRSHFYTGESKIPNDWLLRDMWKPRNDKQPAFALPGIGQINGGPSGLTYNPSNYLGQNLEDTFFVIHFKGAPEQTYVSTFKVEENGAGFTMVDNEEFIRGINTVDLDFGPDGRLYLTEFNYGSWQMQDEGSILVVSNPAEKSNTETEEFEKLLTSDFSQYSIDELTAFLGRNHQHLRLRAQYELAKRKDEAVAQFTQLALDKNGELFKRIHGIWGLGQMAYSSAYTVDILLPLIALLNDSDNQVRIQVAKVLGDHKVEAAADKLIAALEDKHARVAMYAAIGLGRMKHSAAIPAVIKALEKHGDQDLWLQHGFIMTLQGLDKHHWIEHKTSASDNVRMAVLLVLRRLADPEIKDFLDDKNPKIVQEAITAINDLPIVEARPQLAALLKSYIKVDKKAQPKNAIESFMLHRLINANYDEGGANNAEHILAFAQNPNVSPRLLAEALAAIEAWHTLNPIDSTTGLPARPNRDRADIKALVHQYLPSIIDVAKGQAVVQVMRIADANEFTIASDVLVAQAKDTSNITGIREQALQTLLNRKHEKLAELASDLLKDAKAPIRAKALEVIVALGSAQGTSAALEFANSGNWIDQQAALRVIKNLEGDKIDVLIITKMQALLDGNAEAASLLELIDAAKAKSNPEIVALVKQHEARMANADIMTQFAGALEGGNVQRGKDLFFGGGAGECLRCHEVKRKGSRVGPVLTKIADYHDKHYLLEAMVDPSAVIAPGFGSMAVTLASEEKVSGIFMGEDDNTLKLKMPDETIQKFVKAELKEIQRPISGMPPMNYLLSPYQLRDLTAYLATLKTQARKNNKAH